MDDQTRKAFDEAVRLKESGDLRGAKSILLDIAQKNPHTASIFAVLGDVCWDLNQLSEASTWFAKAVEIAPFSEAVSVALFHCLWGQGKREDALRETRRFLSHSDSADYREIIQELHDKWVVEGSKGEGAGL